MAGRMLALVTSVTPAFELIEPLMAALISILENSSVSSASPAGPDWLNLSDAGVLTLAVMEDEDAQHARAELGILPKPLPPVRDLQSEVSGCGVCFA